MTIEYICNDSLLYTDSSDFVPSVGDEIELIPDEEVGDDAGLYRVIRRRVNPQLKSIALYLEAI